MKTRTSPIEPSEAQPPDPRARVGGRMGAFAVSMGGYICETATGTIESAKEHSSVIMAACAIAVSAAGGVAAETALGDGGPDTTRGRETYYEQDCDRYGTENVISGVYAKRISRTRLTIRVAVLNNTMCDTDGREGNSRGQYDPYAVLDAGDREFYIFRQTWNGDKKKWVASSPKVHLNGDRVAYRASVGTGFAINRTIRTPKARPGTRSRAAVEVRWLPHDEEGANSRVFGSKSFRNGAS